MSIYSNENIRKIVKLSPREFPHLVQNCKNYCVYSISYNFFSSAYPSKQRQLHRQQAHGGRSTVRGRETAGTASSVAFTPLQVSPLFHQNGHFLSKMLPKCNGNFWRRSQVGGGRRDFGVFFKYCIRGYFHGENVYFNIWLFIVMKTSQKSRN